MQQLGDRMTCIYLNDANDSRLDPYIRLTEAQLRKKLEPDKGILIAESLLVIESALDAGCTIQSMLMEEKRIASSESLIARIGPEVPVFILPRSEIEKLTGYELTRGVLAVFSRPALPSYTELVSKARRIAILEGFTSYTNVGALFRSAAALGIDAVLVNSTCCDPWYRRSVRVSMGAVFHIPWARIGGEVREWPEGAIALLKDEGFKVISLALEEGALSIDDPQFENCEKLAFIFGTEGTGLDKKTIACSDCTAMIPMGHGIDSLNVAAASAVVFWHFRR